MTLLSFYFKSLELHKKGLVEEAGLLLDVGVVYYIENDKEQGIEDLRVFRESYPDIETQELKEILEVDK